MFRAETKEYDGTRKAYSLSDVILPPALSLSFPAPTQTAANLTPSTLISPSSSITSYSMGIPENFPTAFTSSSSSQTYRTLPSQVESHESMLTATQSQKPLLKPPQRPPACRACKRRKSKCDFERPCSTCMLHNTVDSCAYDKLVVPRDRKAGSSRSTPAGGTSTATRTSQLKTLRGRLAEAEKLIATQKLTIQDQQASLELLGRRTELSDSRSSEHSRLTGEGSGTGRSNQSQSGDSSAPMATLVEGLTHLVIHSAIAPSNKSNKPIPPSSSSPPSSPPAPALIARPISSTSGEDSRPSSLEVLAAQDASSLRADVLRLLLKHSGFTYLANMRIGSSGAGSRWLGPLPGLPSYVTQSPTHPAHSLPNFAENTSPLNHHPPTTILPSCINIRDPRDLLGLFPPSFDQASRLLESYLGFVNQVHHLVDGEQARVELKLLYDTYMPANRSTDDSQPVQPDGDKQPPMPIPELLEIGWLSGTLAIFVLGSKSDDQGELGGIQSLRRLWLKGALEGLAYRFDDASKNGGRPIDLSTLRCACLVVWIFVLYGKDEDIPPAVNFNSMALYRACDHLQLHRDPLKVFPGMSPRVAEDRRRVFYNMINTDWLFSAIIGKTYSPVSLDGHDVQIPRALEGRDENSDAIDSLGFRSLLMRQLRKLATLWIGPGMIREDQALGFENDLDRLDLDMPEWCVIDVDNFEPAKYTGDPKANLTFSQQIITNVQLCAVRVRFHSKLAVPSDQAPQWVHESAAHHRKICIERAIRLLRIEQIHLTYTTRVLGHSGYPRFHPIVGGLTLSAFMAKSRDRTERNTLFNELTRFTKFIQSCGSLSQVTNLGILAIETALAQVEEEERLAEEESRKEAQACGAENIADKSKACSTKFSRPKEDREEGSQSNVALFNHHSGSERRFGYCYDPRNPSVGPSTQRWALGTRGPGQEDARHCHPRSIDEFLSLANVIGTGQGEQHQLADERTGGSSLGWGITPDRYWADGGLDTRTESQGDTVEWAGFSAPGMASAAISMMNSAMGERVGYGLNVGSLAEGRSDANLASTRPGGNPPYHHTTNHDGGARYSKLLLPTHPPMASTSTFTPPYPITIPERLSNKPPFNSQAFNQPPPSTLRTCPPFLVASSRSFSSGIPPFSAPVGSGFVPFLDPSQLRLTSSGPRTSSVRFTSQPGLGGGCDDCSYSRNPDGTVDSSDGVFDSTTGLLSPSYVDSSTSASFSSNLYGPSSSSSSGPYSPWKEEW